ncbi:Sec1-like snare [Pyrrhoderma noxium]|uniref:Sec1-like snare n=1 Tax=Pyrrhoderma noxium TaxID=2282107 RepID=A0A286UKR6_9AGAM|nr:Sec1-like snare [Pyrrhoderma noxium]
MSSLLAIVREKFLEAIRSVKPEPPMRWKALVVDEHSQRILYNVLKRNDILEENISTIFVNSDRLYEAQPDQEAMYLLMPTTRNVERIINEFSNGHRQFKRVHLFFVDALSEDLFTRLTQSPAIPYLTCVTELFLNFWPLEPQAFSIQAPQMFFSMFAPPKNQNMIQFARDRLMEDLRFTARHIANMCIILNEFPYIRYYQPTHHAPLGPLVPNASFLPPPPKEGTGRWRTNLARGAVAREYEHAENEYVSRSLACLVQQALEEHEKSNPEFPKKERGRGRATLIITDRSLDTVAPFLHEFTYQAMVNDLLPIQDGVRYLHVHQNASHKEERVDVMLNDDDPVWVDIRHMHMREAIGKLMSAFEKFLKEHTSFRGDGPASIKDMQDMIATLPQYQEQMSKFSLHLTMAQKCMDMFETHNLPALATLEQNCATGLTAEGKTPKTLVEEMVPILDSKDVANLNKLRIIALYIQYREGVPEEDRRRLCQHARLKMAEIDAINGLTHLGVRITRGPADKDIKRKVKSKISSEEEYDLSRYKPVLQTVVDDHISGKLDTSIFPYVKDSPLQNTSSSKPTTPIPQTTSLRSTRPTWHKAPKPGAGGSSPSTSSAPRDRLLVFVLGGMTYSEMRTCYARSEALNKDVYVGSTHVLTPEGFMDDLKVLELEGPEPVPPRAASAPVVDPRLGGGSGGRSGSGGGGGSGGGSPLLGVGAPKLGSSHSMSSVRTSDSGVTDPGKKKKLGFFRF